MFFLRDNNKKKGPAEFWQEYEARIGEKVLAYSLGRYIQGWDTVKQPLWGLLIVSTGGFHFHHFPHESWLSALSRSTSGEEAPKEKIIFIPKEQLLGAELKIEKSWLKQIFFSHPPLFAVRYLTDAGSEAELIAETEKKSEALAERIRELLFKNDENQE